MNKFIDNRLARKCKKCRKKYQPAQIRLTSFGLLCFNCVSDFQLASMEFEKRVIYYEV